MKMLVITGEMGDSIAVPHKFVKQCSIKGMKLEGTLCDDLIMSSVSLGTV